MNASVKGSSFERKVARILSLWWTGDRDDVFWRTAGSGARATTRAKQGLETAFSVGDLTMIDPIGKPFLQVFTVECKKGYNKELDLMNLVDSNAKNRLLEWWNELFNKAMFRNTTPLLIVRRDFREIVVCVSSVFYWNIYEYYGQVNQFSKLTFNRRECGGLRDFIMFRFDDFLSWVEPKWVKEVAIKQTKTSGSMD